MASDLQQKLDDVIKLQLESKADLDALGRKAVWMAERIAELEAQNAKLREALEAAEKADEAVCNCEEHEPEMAPETCEWCFPVVDDARIKRWIALGKLPDERREELSDMQHETQTRKE